MGPTPDNFDSYNNVHMSVNYLYILRNQQKSYRNINPHTILGNLERIMQWHIEDIDELNYHQHF